MAWAQRTISDDQIITLEIGLHDQISFRSTVTTKAQGSVQAIVEIESDGLTGFGGFRLDKTLFRARQGTRTKKTSPTAPINPDQPKLA